MNRCLVYRSLNNFVENFFRCLGDRTRPGEETLSLLVLLPRTLTDRLHLNYRRTLQLRELKEEATPLLICSRGSAL